MRIIIIIIIIMEISNGDYNGEKMPNVIEQYIGIVFSLKLNQCSMAKAAGIDLK